MFRIAPPIRTMDKHGTGEYLAPRGNRKHNGIDLACAVGSEVFSPVAGTVTKLGYPYGSGTGGASDADPYRYVEVTDEMGRRHRVFYIDPNDDNINLTDLDEVDQDTIIGIVQDLTRRYEGITPHVHYEIMVGAKTSKTYIDPLEWL